MGSLDKRQDDGEEQERARRAAAGTAPGKSSLTSRHVARAAGAPAAASGPAPPTPYDGSSGPDSGPAPMTTPVLIAHGLDVSRPGDASEAEADRAASAMLAGERAAVSPVAAGVGRKVIARDFYDDLEWGADYQKPVGPRDEKVDYDSYKDKIGEDKNEAALVPASQWEQQTDAWNKSARPGDPEHQTGKERKGFARSTVLTEGEWNTILAATQEPPTIEKCKPMLGGVNQAFTIMMLDTAQSQALYIAHLAGETGGKLEETIDATSGPRDYDNDRTGHFRGRGPVQVTFRKGYVKSIAYLETRAEQLEKEAEEKEKQLARAKEGTDDEKKKVPQLEQEVKTAKEQAKLCRDAVAAIKENPEAAADPRYAFLFSAAFMHMSGKVRSSSGYGDAESFDGNSKAAVSGTTTTFDDQAKAAAAKGDAQTVRDMGSANSRKAVKERVYAAAMAILTGKQKPKEP